MAFYKFIISNVNTKIIGHYCTFVPLPFSGYWWFIMKKFYLTLTVNVTLTLRGVRKCNIHMEEKFKKFFWSFTMSYDKDFLLVLLTALSYNQFHCVFKLADVLPKFFFHHKWNDVQLLLINMVYTSCQTSCRTT